MIDSLGDRLKKYEMREDRLLLSHNIPIVARLDGRSFSSFCRGLEKPYDTRLSSLMIDTTKYLVQETNANCGYTQSDEITLTWYTDDYKTEILFNGRLQKMVSILASMASVYFIHNLPNYNLAPYVNKLPQFDARVFNVPSLEEGVNCFLWRERDCHKNSITMAAQQYYSHDTLHNKNSSDKHEMLFARGINWNDYPEFFRRGSYIQRKIITRKFTTEEIDKLPPKHEARNNPNLMVERTDYISLDLPPLNAITNKVDVIYFGKDYKKE